MPDQNLLVWVSDVHMVSGDFETGILGRTTPTEADAFATYLSGTLDPIGVIDTGDAKDHYGADTGDELANYDAHVLASFPWLPLNIGFNAQAPLLPGNHDEISEYQIGSMPGDSDLSLFDAALWGDPYHWTADWGFPQIRFIGIHSYVHHSQDGYAGFWHCDEAAWLETQLAALPANWVAIVCSHPPANPTFGSQIRGAPNNFGGDELLTVLETYSTVIPCYLNGHRHQNMGTSVLSDIVHINGGSTAYTIGNSAGGYMPITYDEAGRTLTFDFKYFRGASIHQRVAGFTPIEIQLPPLASNVDPVASFTTSANTGSPVDFDASGSTDPDAGGIVSYVWDFGDGETGSGQTLTHVYAATGTYTASLTVTDNRGGVDIISQSVTAAVSTGGSSRYFCIRL